MTDLFEIDDFPMTKVTKKGRSKKAPVAAPPTPPPSVEAEAPAKKPRTEKQIAAFEKAKETRRLKKEALEAEKEVAKQKEADAVVEAAKVAKKEAAKQKRLAKKASTIAEAVDVAVKEEPQVEKPKRKRAQKSKAEEVVSEAAEAVDVIKPKAKRAKKATLPPAPETSPEWLKEMVHGIVTEKMTQSGETKPKKQIRNESNAIAEQKWQDPVMRDSVHELQNRYTNKMYGMIFGERANFNKV